MAFLLSPVFAFGALMSRSSSVIESRKTSSGDPPTPESKLPVFGNYCIKASNSVQSEDGQVSFEGYYDDMSIVETVEAKCKQFEKNGHKCTPTQMCFLGPMRECNRIKMTNDEGVLINEWYLL